jgi:hypothetical protein
MLVEKGASPGPSISWVEAEAGLCAVVVSAVLVEEVLQQMQQSMFQASSSAAVSLLLRCLTY